MFDKQKVLKNISDRENKIIFARVLDKAYLCLKNFEPSFSEFLDPYRASELLKIIKYNVDCNIYIFGGIENAERCKIGFFPEHMQAEKKFFPISAILAEYNEKYSRKLSHRDFLGSLIGMGIDRSRVGDIIVKNSSAIIFIDSDMAEYVSSNLEQAGRTKLKCTVIELKDVDIGEQSFDEKNITVASLRVDAVLSSALNISRSKTADMINAEKAFINWNVVQSISENVSEGDIVTLRGNGRIKIIEILGKTKKDRFLIHILKFV